MNSSLLVAILVILGTIFSGVLSTLSPESGIFASFILLGGLTNGPASPISPGGAHFF